MEAIKLLEKEYGRPKRGRCGNPVDALVRTILSQNTSDANRDRAFQLLKKRFPENERLLEASVKEIAKAIRPGGLPEVKARRIKNALARIKAERGRLELDFLKGLPLGKAREFLTSIYGVGPKTAAVVLNFCFGKPAFPVDTHIYRVAKRLGLIPEKATREKAHELMEAAVPEEKMFSFHVNLIAHGRRVCTARNPKCPECALLAICLYGKKAVTGKQA